MRVWVWIWWEGWISYEYVGMGWMWVLVWVCCGVVCCGQGCGSV